MVALVCKHNQNGYCKFGKHCRNRHVEEICSRTKCQQPSCEMRHPLICKFYRMYGNCKFENNCAFLHEASEEQVKVKLLEEKVEACEDKVKMLESIVGDLKEKIDKAKVDTREAINENVRDTEEVTPNKREGNFSCEFCEFKGLREIGLEIHMSRKHKNIEQLDGNVDFEDDDQLFLSTERYWSTGILGSCYQTYLDALELLDESTLEENAKKVEKDKVLDARKEAFGDQYMYYPPWRKF